MPLLSSLLRNAFPQTLGLLVLLGGVLTIGDRASAMAIDSWKYDPERGQIEFEIADGVKPRHFLMAQPARIVVDLQDTQQGNAPAEMSYTSGPIQRITVEQLQPQLTRVTLYMFPSTVFAKGQVAIERVGEGNRSLSDVWALRPLLKSSALNSEGLNPSGLNAARSNLEASAQIPSPQISSPQIPITPALQIKTETQTLIQTQSPAPTPALLNQESQRQGLPTQGLPTQVPLSSSQSSQSIPIVVPAPQSEVVASTIASRFSGIQPATPPQLDEMPPGMAAVVKAPVVNPFQLPTKLETVKPESKPEVKPESKPEVKPEAPKLATSQAIDPPKPETPKLETPKLEAPKPEASQIAATPIVPITSLFPPSTETPVSTTIPIAVPPANGPKSTDPQSVIRNPQSSPSVAQADGIVLPDTLPTLAPTNITQPSTVSVPPLSTIPAVSTQQAPTQQAPTQQAPTQQTPGQFPPQVPLSAPIGQPTGLSSSSAKPFPVQPFPLPDQIPQTIQQSQQPSIQQSYQQPPYQQPPYQQPQQQSFPLPDRIPTVIPQPSTIQQPIAQPIMQPIARPIQPNLVPAAGIAQPIDRNPIASNPASVQPNVINFGQPLVTTTPPEILPISQSTSQSTFGQSIVENAGSIVAMNSNDGRVGLPAGTTLQVRYTGISAIRVKGETHQEMLVLQSPIRDRNGAVLAPVGSTIYGSFVDNRFVAQAIVLQGQAISLVAESSNLGGARNPSERSLLQNSGLGLLAGVLVGGLSGGSAVGGAAAGAIVSYATAPKVTTIQPGQTLDLKLTQDWIFPANLSVSQAVGG